MIIAGIMVRPDGESIAWGYWFGFAENSTILGKVLYLVGVMSLIGGIYAFLGD